MHDEEIRRHRATQIYVHVIRHLHLYLRNARKQGKGFLRVIDDAKIKGSGAIKTSEMHFKTLGRKKRRHETLKRVVGAMHVLLRASFESGRST